MTDDNKNKIPQDNKDLLLTGTTLGNFQESPANAYEDQEEKMGSEENKKDKNIPGEQSNLNENEQQGVGVAMNQERQGRSSNEPTKGSRQNKEAQDRLNALNRRLSILKKGAKAKDIWFFVSTSIGFTFPVWWLIIPFIIEFLVIIPGIVIFVAIGILKGPSSIKTTKSIKKTSNEIKELQANSTKN